jgi:hypothetical protein
LWVTGQLQEALAAYETSQALFEQHGNQVVSFSG